MRRLFLALFAASSLAACAVPIRATISPAQLAREVERAEDLRDGHAPALAHAVSAQQRELRIGALRALARIEEVGTSSIAIPLLGDRDVEVARWAAFALGQIAEPEGEAALRTALKTGLSKAPEQVMRSLGRSGTATAARELAFFLKDSRPEYRGNAALAIGLIAKRLPGVLPRDRYTTAIAPLVKDPDRDVRFGAVYALFRLGGPVAAVRLISALADGDPDIRAHAVRGLGAAGAAPQVLDRIMSDGSWQVRVEAARALGAMGVANPTDVPSVLVRLRVLIPREFARMKRGELLASGRATHVLRAVIDAASALGPAGRGVIEEIERTPWGMEAIPAEVSPDLARIQCAVAFALDRLDREVRRVNACGDASIPTWRRRQLAARVWSEIGDAAAVTALVEMGGSQDPRVRAAAVEALSAVDLPEAATSLATFLSTNDPYVAAAVAESMLRAKVRSADLLTRIAPVLERQVAQPDAGLVVGILDAVGALGAEGRPFLPHLEALASDPRHAIRRRAAAARAAITGQPVRFGPREVPLPYAVLPPRKDPIQVEVRTVRGAFTLELFADVAPHTVGTLVGLAERGYYKDLTFHRVVSDFVAQGGCPRGDGWGGPGFTIGDETSPLRFERGAVGIATNGRDTGGSQFFVMHGSHPHLDGGYTLLGRVLAGIDVLDALQEDDRILEIRPNNGRTERPGVP